MDDAWVIFVVRPCCEAQTHNTNPELSRAARNEESKTMHPVLAEQELQVITMRRHRLQTDGERDKCLPKRSLRLNRSFWIDAPVLAGMRAWVRTVGERSALVGSRSPAEVGENRTEAVI